MSRLPTSREYDRSVTQSIATPEPLLWAAEWIEQDLTKPGADSLVQDERVHRRLLEDMPWGHHPPGHHLSALYFGYLPGRQPFLVHCSFRIQNFHRLKHWNTFVYQILVTHRIVSFLRDVIFMIFW